MKTFGRIRNILHVIVLSLSVCVVQFGRAAEGDVPIKRIIVAVSPVTAYHVTIGAVGLGAIGGAVKSSDTAEKSKQLTEKARELGVPDIGATIADGLEKELAKRGYEIIRGKGVKVESPEDSQTDAQPDAPQQEADAVLSVILLSPGFRAQHAVTDYHPNIRALVSLRDPKSRAVLHSTRVVYGDTYLSSGTTVLPVDSKYSYPSFEALLANAGEAFEGLAKGVAPVVSAIASGIPSEAKPGSATPSSGRGRRR